MPWTYSQSTGTVTNPEGRNVGSGYSGSGVGLNNPSMQTIENVGPIPQGSYTIGRAFTDPHRGPEAMRLTPNAGTRTPGRDGGFMIHADNRQHNNTASEGCIILAPGIRDQIGSSLDRTLNVVP